METKTSDHTNNLSTTDYIVPVASLKLFEFSKILKTLSISSDAFGMPRAIDIKSHHTGKTVRFVVDVEDMIAHEHYDGEVCTYYPITPQRGVNRLIIRHEW